jgi:DNA invertase Pin-like site-specific DNA recombinase
MLAAVYARKSTEQASISDEEKSVARQVEHAKLYASRKGWAVDERYIYVDDGISGAEFVKRPGFIKLMNALKPCPPFQVLIMSEESRLGREQIETAYAIKQIIDSGVRIYFYLEDRERTLNSALDKVMLSLANFASEMERERGKQRTHDAMLRKVKAGHVVGGKTYGYDNVDLYGEQGPDGKRQRQCVVRRVNDNEAAVVRRIFEAYASGLGLTRIAKVLNSERVPPPRHSLHGWAPSAIREMLHRQLYKGVALWNRSQAVQRGGTTKQRQRPESEWLRLDSPELRIISDQLWDRVQGRLTEAHHSYFRGPGGRRKTRYPGDTIESPYLLSGIARCAVCGGSVSVFQRSRGPYIRKLYGCVYYHKRGSAICSNSRQIPMDALDSAVLHALQEALDGRLLEEAVRRALVKIRGEETKFPNQRIALERELSLIETRLRHLVEAVAQGQGTDSLFATLHAEEDRKKALLHQLGELNNREKVIHLDAKRLYVTWKQESPICKAYLLVTLPKLGRFSGNW